jgi:hypothetical protein
MKGVLVGWSGDDGVDFAAEGEPGCGLDRVTGYAAGTDDSISVAVGVATAESPGANRDATLGRYGLDLVFRAYQRDLRLERLRQSTSRDLRPDTTGVAERYRKPRT